MTQNEIDTHPMKSHRLARVAEVVREVAAEAILFDLRDPRVKFVTVTRAEVSADLQHAKVFVSVLGSEREQQLTLHGLRSAAGFIQSKLADRMKSRFVPVLQFLDDQGVKNAIAVSKLINDALGRTGDAELPPADPLDVLDDDEIDEDEDEDGAEAGAADKMDPDPAAGKADADRAKPTAGP